MISADATGAALKFKLNPLHTLVFKIEEAGGTIGNVDNSTSRQRAAIIDANDDNSAVLQVGDSHAGAKRQSWVCCGQAIHVKRFAACGSFPVVRTSEP
jgi:hypothetical protein